MLPRLSSRNGQKSGKTRFIIHAGFPKTGSTTIQAALIRNLDLLRAQSVFVFGRLLTLDTGDWTGLPLWTLEELQKTTPEGESVAPRLAGEIDSIKSKFPGVTAVLTSENLQNSLMPRLFKGIDSMFDVSVVFYMRPQYRWIPSAWKQWTLKKGVSLDTFVKQCVKVGRPFYRGSLDAWQSALPEAKIVVRPLLQEVMRGGDPALDFFDILAVEDRQWKDWSDVNNPSLDYSLLHVLHKNPKLFENVHDNNLFYKLAEMLPKEYHSTNIDMLSQETAREIQNRFRKENLYILDTYCNSIGLSTEELYEMLFEPRATPHCYSDIPEEQVVERAARILLEAIAAEGQRANQ